MAQDSDGPEHLSRPSSIAYELMISGSFYLHTNGIAVLHQIASTAPSYKSQTAFYQRDPIHQTPHETRVLIILNDKTQRWFNTVFPHLIRAVQHHVVIKR